MSLEEEGFTLRLRIMTYEVSVVATPGKAIAASAVVRFKSVLYHLSLSLLLLSFVPQNLRDYI